MNSKLYDMLKMSCDIIFHYLQKALWDPGLDRSGWWQRCEASPETSWRDRWGPVRNQGAGDPRTGGDRRGGGDT